MQSSKPGLSIAVICKLCYFLTGTPLLLSSQDSRKFKGPEVSQSSCQDIKSVEVSLLCRVRVRPWNGGTWVYRRHMALSAKLARMNYVSKRDSVFISSMVSIQRHLYKLTMFCASTQSASAWLPQACD